MPIKQDPTDLGPLPKVPRTDELERLSFTALDLVLPKDRFLLRSEEKDKGVDLSIELLVDSQATNLRSQIQLKSTDTTETNRDGSVSYSIDASNLNYLLYGGNAALYVLFIAPRNELRFAWASEERRRPDQEKPEWMQQQTITMRFDNLLSPEATEQTYKRVLQEARFHRKINDDLSRASLDEQVTININPETLETINAADAKVDVLTSGITMVASGYGNLVLRAIQLMHSSDRELPRVQTIQAYAHYTLGGYQDALACIGRALLRQAELTSADKHFLRDLRNSCRYETGQLSYSEYSQLLQQGNQQEDPDVSFLHRLNHLRYTLLNESDQAKRSEMIVKFRSLVNELCNAPKVSSMTKLDAQLLLLEADGHQLIIEAMQGNSQLHLRLQLGTMSFCRFQEIKQSQIKGITAWFKEIEAALQEARERRNPLLIGNALTIKAQINIGLLMVTRSFFLKLGQYPDYPEGIMQMMMQEVAEAVAIYKQARQLEGELRAQLLLADLFLLARQSDAAQRLAKGALPKAQAMDYAVLQTKAREHLSGKTPIHLIEKAIIATANEDMDWKTAKDTDEGMLDIARKVLQALDLPQERLPVVEREVHSMRTIARERLAWCKYIEMIQDLRHTSHPITFYLSDPERFCRCEKRGHESAIGHTDANLVINTFKQTFCQNCFDRSPKESK